MGYNENMFLPIYQALTSPWFWLAAVVVFSAIEFATSFTLTTIWFAISALIMVFVSLFTRGLDHQTAAELNLGIFAVLSVLLLIFTRPFAVKKLKVGRIKTNVDALVGQECPVTKDIKALQRGEIKLDGKIWAAECENQGELSAGETCVVSKIEGAHAIVRPVLQ
jgi:membrane protein implicated in regulation of membrane protease activity